MTCADCNNEYPDALALAIHRKAFHPTQWRTDQEANLAALRAKAARDEADAEARRQRELAL